MLVHEFRKIKILHIGEYVQGGVATYLHTIIGLDDNLFDEYVVLSEEKSSHDWNLSREKIYYYNYKRGIKGVIRAIGVVLNVIRKVNPDIIYCHSTWAGLIGRMAFLIARKKSKIIYNAHGWSFLMETDNWKKNLYAFLEKLLAKYTDCIINVSRFEYNAAIDYGICENKMCVIYSGTEKPKDYFKEDNFIKDKTKVNLLFVGRFDTQKGVDYLIENFEKYLGNHVHLYLIGDTILSHGKKYCVEDGRIFYLGWVPHNKIANYYCDCDAVIMPSRWEAFGLVAVEAMKYHKPVIVSNRGALPEIIDHGITGYVFDFDNPKSLYEIFNKLDKDELRLMGNNAFERYIHAYTADYMRENYKRLYESVCNKC